MKLRDQFRWGNGFRPRWFYLFAVPPSLLISSPFHKLGPSSGVHPTRSKLKSFVVQSFAYFGSLGLVLVHILGQSSTAEHNNNTNLIKINYGRDEFSQMDLTTLIFFF